MCRWMAWHGQPVLIEELLFKTQHGIVDQSLHSRMGAEPTNGDGFGVGWYGAGEGPGVYHSVAPAWGDANLRELAGHVESPLFLVHVRAAIGSPVTQTNCHPFRHGHRLWMHNGFLDGFVKYKRELAFAVDPSLYPLISGTTDSELVFYLALTFGLDDDPADAVAKAIGFIEDRGRRAGVDFPFQGTIVTSDGEAMWAFRYSSEGKSRTLFFTRQVPVLREEYPSMPVLRSVSDDARLVVSEPIGNLPGAWLEMPEATYGIVQKGDDELRPFAPRLAT